MQVTNYQLISCMSDRMIHNFIANVRMDTELHLLVRFLLISLNIDARKIYLYSCFSQHSIVFLDLYINKFTIFNC